AVAEAIRAHLPISEDRLHVVGVGVADAVARPPAAAEAVARAARLRLPAVGYLLSLATLEPRKGLDTALAALTQPGCPDLPLLHVGPNGWGDLDLDREAARLGVPPGRVRSLGRIDDSDLAVVLSRASLLLAPSRSEGFGLPVLEALAHGVPAVVSDVPALVEVGGDGVVAVPVDDPVALAAAIGDVMGNPTLRSK
nr:glycosyltransferase [Micromonospora sp. DSM 115978]